MLGKGGIDVPPARPGPNVGQRGKVLLSISVLAILNNSRSVQQSKIESDAPFDVASPEAGSVASTPGREDITP